MSGKPFDFFSISSVHRGLKMRLLAVVATLAVALTFTARAANLLVNGSFESASTPATPVGGSNNVSPGSGVTLPGWTVALGTGGNGPGVYLASAGSTGWIPNPQDGNFCLQLDSTNNVGFTTGNSIQQSVTLAANTTYWLTFRINTEYGPGKGNTSGVDVTIRNPGGTNIVNAVRFTTTSGAVGSNPPATTPWTTCQIQFKTTTAGSYTFRFQDDVISANSNIALDNIVLDTVPEVSNWLAFFFFGALCVSQQRWRRPALAA